MTTSRNDITGDAIQTKGSSDAYRDGWDRIFGKKEEEPVFHLRSYGDVTEAELLELTEQRKPLPTTAYFLQCIEYERGWGSNPDGYVGFASKEDADAFVANHIKDRTNDVPDYYVNYEHYGWQPVSVCFAASIQKNGKGFVQRIHEAMEGDN